MSELSDGGAIKRLKDSKTGLNVNFRDINLSIKEAQVIVYQFHLLWCK